MDEKRIKELLDIIGFDYKKHETIKAAVKDIIDSETYAPLMNGVVSDESLLKNVRMILDSYKELKSVNVNELQEVIDKIKNSEEKEVNDKDIIIDDDDESISEILFDDSDEEYVLILKKDENGNYQEMNRIPKDKFSIEFYTYSISGNGTFNFLGKKISDNDKVSFITDNIYKIKNKNNITFLHLDGRKIDINDDNSNLALIFDIKLKDEQFERVFDLYFESELEYLKYDIKEFGDKYLYCVNNNEACYFDYEGNKIISSEDGYPFIEKIGDFSAEDGRHIVVVAEYNDEFELKYGYYDLDNKEIIQKPIFDKAYSWKSYITVAKNNDDIAYLYTISDQKLVKIASLEKLNNLFPKKVFKLNDSIYLVITDNFEYILVKNLLTNPQVIGLDNKGYFRDYRKADYVDDDIYVTSHHDVMKAIKVGNDGPKIENLSFNHLSKNIGQIDSNDAIGDYSNNRLKLECDGNDVKKLGTLANSNFLLPMFRNSNDLMVLDKNELAVQTNKYAISNIPREKKVIARTNEATDEIEISHIYSYGGRIHFKKKNSDKYSILNPTTKKILTENKNMKLMHTLSDGTIVVRTVFGNGYKKYILDRDFRIIVGPVDDVINCHYKNILIVRNGGLEQLFQNGVPISYQADKIFILNKYYVDSKGVVIDEDRIFKIKNKHSKFIVDSGHELVIEQSQETTNLLNQIFDIMNTDSLEDKNKTKKIGAMIYDEKEL